MSSSSRSSKPMQVLDIYMPYVFQIWGHLLKHLPPLVSISNEFISMKLTLQQNIIHSLLKVQVKTCKSYGLHYEYFPYFPRVLNMAAIWGNFSPRVDSTLGSERVNHFESAHCTFMGWFNYFLLKFLINMKTTLLETPSSEYI